MYCRKLAGGEPMGMADIPKLELPSDLADVPLTKLASTVEALPLSDEQRESVGDVASLIDKQPQHTLLAQIEALIAADDALPPDRNS